MAEISPVFMIPRFIEVYPDGFPVTATQKIRVAEIRETPMAAPKAKAYVFLIFMNYKFVTYAFHCFEIFITKFFT